MSLKPLALRAAAQQLSRRRLLHGAVGAAALGGAAQALAQAPARTGWVEDPRFATPAFEPGHPEQPLRVQAIVQRVRADAALWPRLAPLQPLDEASTATAIARVHSAAHVQGIARQHGAAVDSLARAATAAALAAVAAVGRGRLANAFVASRPPGHHARNTGREEGFCFYNHVAVAARHVQQVLGFERVLIVDWDVHHGDGTEQLFYADPSVFYFSTFDAHLYPGTGDAARGGAGAGAGTTLNHPLPRGAGDDAVLAAYRQALLPAAQRFKPQFVLVSAGFDSRQGDLLGRFNFTDAGYRQMTALVAGMARQHAGGRLVSVLEGGYHLSGLASAAHAHLAALVEAAA